MPVLWASNTPADFCFTVKFPQVVTHDARLGGGLEGLEKYYNAMKPLGSKLVSADAATTFAKKTRRAVKAGAPCT